MYSQFLQIVTLREQANLQFFLKTLNILNLSNIQREYVIESWSSRLESAKLTLDENLSSSNVSPTVALQVLIPFSVD